MPASGERDDTSLVLAVARADQEALAEIYRRHAAAVYGLARRVLRDDGLAEDVTQTVFVRLWQRPERFDPDRGTLRTFLVSDAHGRAVDLVRAEEARRRRESDDGTTRRAVTDDVERMATTALDSAAVRQALMQLPDDERSAIMLAYYDGHSYRQVAELLDAPEGTVKSRIRAGLRRLRGLVDVTGVAP